MTTANGPLVAIVGAGPAGMAAALQLKRMGVPAILFERETPGGLLRNAGRVENYPGFPGGVDGPALVRLFFQQIQAHRVTVRREGVVQAAFRRGRFHLSTDRGHYAVRYLILASGTRPIPFNGCAIPKEARPLCHDEVWPLRRLRGRQIVIVGGGDAAFDYALTLAQHNRVAILMRGAAPRCLRLLWERAQRLEKISLLSQARLAGVRRLAETRLALIIESAEGRRETETHRLLFAVGREPALGYLAPALRRRIPELTRAGRLHLIGDAANGRFRQTAIAVGDGLRAAMAVAEEVSL